MDQTGHPANENGSGQPTLGCRERIRPPARPRQISGRGSERCPGPRRYISILGYEWPDSSEAAVGWRYPAYDSLG